jgi:Fe-S oxidoreductase
MTTATVPEGLQASLEEMSEKCIECKLCVKQCAFLQKYGTPKEIADNWQLDDSQAQTMAFECSLCSLCTAVCPVDIDPQKLFLELRRNAVNQGISDFSKQSPFLNFEKRGTSQRYSFYGLPTGCDTVLFPGCALAGSRPKRVMQLFNYLQNPIPNLGIVLDCCTKPSHDLGRTEFFQAMFDEMKNYFVEYGVKNILVTCPSCYAVFKKYGKGLNTRTVYEILETSEWNQIDNGDKPLVTVQDSCTARFETGMQESVRNLIRARGISFEEMKSTGKKTLCCGEGGGACFVAPDLAGQWGERRKEQALGRRIITYCAGCANFLGKVAGTSHLLDLVFEPEKTFAGKVRVSKAPITYLNRLLLKWKFKRMQSYNNKRERTFTNPD